MTAFLRITATHRVTGLTKSLSFCKDGWKLKICKGRAHVVQIPA